MKNVFILMYVLILLCTGCAERSNNPQVSIIYNEERGDSLFYSVIKKFSLPYPDDFVLDSNALIFYGSRPFDTSFLIHLKNESQEIAGVYYEVIPTYHNDIDNFAVKANKILFFEGYSFILESSKWEEIKKQAERLLKDSAAFNISNACRDCEVYGLRYGSKSNVGNTVKYKPYYKYLKEVLLDSLVVKRKPIMYKEK
ncbi:MAG: hypothetical protein J0I32_12975 [Sphingobacteriales bacterium]|nr:hypothetical protein [Sphingobacteriales bacterium]OJW03151.1 MAG: hypothetical protein BGO52_02325 [Sphingobacteriales bacterium 44-61]